MIFYYLNNYYFLLFCNKKRHQNDTITGYEKISLFSDFYFLTHF